MNTAQLIFNEINTHLLSDEKPSEYLNQISCEAVFQRAPFHLLLKLKSTEQSRQHHPEGNVWNHTMLVIDQAAVNRNKSKRPQVFMWAALLHDIGKPDTTRYRKGKITSYNHDELGAKLTRQFLSAFDLDNAFIDQVVALVRWHMQILFVVNGLPFANVNAMKQDVDIREIALLGFCDRMGRLNVDKSKEDKIIRTFIKMCSDKLYDR